MVEERMPYLALVYEAAPDYLERRPLYRDERLRLARAAQTRGEPILGGAFATNEWTHYSPEIQSPRAVGRARSNSRILPSFR
jgi:hypothetical protein